MELKNNIGKNPKDHPCFGCEHFMGYESIETMDTCGEFEEDDLMK